MWVHYDILSSHQAHDHRHFKYMFLHPNVERINCFQEKKMNQETKCVMLFIPYVLRLFSTCTKLDSKWM
jgi:hypothetical protein